VQGERSLIVRDEESYFSLAASAAAGAAAAAGWSAGLYVRCTWPFTGSLLATPLVGAVGGPLGGTTTSATWLYATHLPLLLQQQQQHEQQQQQVNEAASGARGVHSGSAAGSEAGPLTVLFQVRFARGHECVCNCVML
jgi:hypothetical protein